MLTSHIFNIIAVGKHSRGFIEDGVLEYSKNLKKFCEIRWHICTEQKYSRGNTANELREESFSIEKILQKIKSPYIICLSEGQNVHSSVQFAENLKKWMNMNINLAFIIGGAYGLDDKIRQQADKELSLSALTFNHQLVRLILLEQLYRALSISFNMQYHH